MMETLIIDASIAVKWVVEEDGTEAAIAMRSRFRFAAPDLLVAECSNILWKKVQRGNLTKEEAVMAGRLLERSDVELLPMRGILEQATTLAIELDHPAYDCVYLALAHQRQQRFVTADQRLLRVIASKASDNLAELCIALDQVHGESR
ncbi:DNA-binding protein [Mesorhizobium sp. L-8-10]|nr:DNA-binding protein [Mesorhizobium sp. L-8-10]